MHQAVPTCAGRRGVGRGEEEEEEDV